MKKLIMVSCLLMIVNLGFSQSKMNLKGPAAKNAKPWNKEYEKTKILYKQDKEFLKGPAAKNVKLWQKVASNQGYAEAKNTNRHNLKGPKFKNSKPWMTPRLKGTESMAIRIKDRDSVKNKLVINQ